MRAANALAMRNLDLDELQTVTGGGAGGGQIFGPIIRAVIRRFSPAVTAEAKQVTKAPIAPVSSELPNVGNGRILEAPEKAAAGRLFGSEENFYRQRDAFMARLTGGQ
jgi:hypothetical protein